MAKSVLKFKDSVAAYEKLAQEIAARRFAPVYLLMGEESYFIDAIAERLATTVLGEAERAVHQITVYGKDSEAGQVINLCRQMPMMGSYQVVILKEAQQLRGLDKLSLYTQKPSPTTILVICHKEKNADRRSAFYKGCAANGAVLESVRPRDYEIASWLQRFIAGKGLAIDTKALSMLTDHLGTDISKISNELGKLVVSLPEGTKRITDADIEANIGISKDYNNFELCKAVATRDMARALTIAEHFARNPKDNPLLVTVLALFGQFKELFVVNYLRWLSRHKGVAFPPDTELMRILKKSNVYVIGEIKQNAANWDNRKVFNILGLLREYDAKSKGMNAGGASDGELLRSKSSCSDAGSLPIPDRTYPRRGVPLPAGTPGRTRPLVAHALRVPGATGRPGGRDGHRGGGRTGSPRQRPFEIRAARPAGIGLPAAGIRRRFALPRLRPAQPDARSRDAAIRTAAVRRPHLGTRGRRRAGTAIRRVAGCERRRTLRPQRDSHGGRRSGAVRHPGQAGLRPAGRSEHRAQPCSQEHPRRRAGTHRSARRA